MRKDTGLDNAQLGITWFERSGQFFCANIDQKKVTHQPDVRISICGHGLGYYLIPSGLWSFMTFIPSASEMMAA